jgi:hypothetical protein
VKVELVLGALLGALTWPAAAQQPAVSSPSAPETRPIGPAQAALPPDRPRPEDRSADPAGAAPTATATPVPDAAQPAPAAETVPPGPPSPPAQGSTPAAGPAPPGQYAPQGAPGRGRRGAWYIGFGLGGGGGSATVGGRSHGFSNLLGRGATSSAFNIRLGLTVTPRLLAGFDGGALGATVSGPTENVQLNVYDLGVMYFPWQEGFYLRGAAGPSNIMVRSDGPVLYGTGTLWGSNVLAGVGYAWWLGRSFNLTFNLDYRRLWHARRGPEGVTTAGGWSAWLGFDWY